MNHNQCTFQGYLLANLCGELQLIDRLPGATIIAVPAEDERAARASGSNAGQDLKPVVRRLDEGELDDITGSSKLVLRGQTDKEGGFCIEQPDYTGGSLDVYAVIERIPLHTDDGVRLHDLETPERLYLGTYRPSTSDQETWTATLYIPQEVYCSLKRRADVWTIAGRVTACDTDFPVGDLTVTAFDVDITQHDELGRGVTDSAGLFRIDYPGDRFREGTIIDVELFGGPDVYVMIEDSDGNTLLEESPTRGRASDRCNAGPCFCFDELCVEIDLPDQPRNPFVPAVWTDVGADRFTIPDDLTLNDFDADGYGVAGATHYAFTGNTLKMMGSAPYLDDPFTVEYRFLVSETPGVNGDPPLSASSFTRTVGAGPADDVDLFRDGVVLGRVVRLSPYKIVKVRARKADLDSDGWLDVKQAVERAFVEDSDVTPADISSFIGAPWGGWDPDVLLAINTRKLAVPSSPGSGLSLSAGDSVPSSELVDVNDGKFAFRFEMRLRNYTTGTTWPLPANGTTLNAIMLDNTTAIRLLAMVDHATDPCVPLQDQVDVTYTVYHPHLQGASITVESNESPPVFDKNLTDSNLPFSASADPNGTDPINNGSLNINTSQVGGNQSLHKCTYLVTLGLSWRLHSGDGAVALGNPQTTFYYEG